MIARRNLDHGYSEEGDEEQFGRGINCTAASLRAMLVFVDGEDHPMDASSELIELMRKAIGDKHGSASVQIIFENRGVSEEFSQLSQQVRGSIGQVQSTLGGSATELRAVLFYIDPEGGPRIAYHDDSNADPLADAVQNAAGSSEGGQTVSIDFGGRDDLARELRSVTEQIGIIMGELK